MTDRPLAIDLCTGLHGWAEGLVKEGWRVRGYDIEDMCAAVGEPRPDHVELVLRSVLLMHGAEVADARLIVASPPCQFFSYTAMPWSLAKERAARTRADPELLEKELAIFRACFRIQREANEVRADKGLPPIPMIVENVRGAEPWVGKAQWSWGSFLLWGNIPALMPPLSRARKNPGFRFDGSGKSFQSESVARHVCAEGIKMRDMDGYERDHPSAFGRKKPATSSHGKARKAASAKIAKIPERLARHIAKTYLPTPENPNPTGQEIDGDFWNYVVTRSVEGQLF